MINNFMLFEIWVMWIDIFSISLILLFQFWWTLLWPTWRLSCQNSYFKIKTLRKFTYTSSCRGLKPLAGTGRVLLCPRVKSVRQDANKAVIDKEAPMLHKAATSAPKLTLSSNSSTAHYSSGSGSTVFYRTQLVPSPGGPLTRRRFGHIVECPATLKAGKTHQEFMSLHIAFFVRNGQNSGQRESGGDLSSTSKAISYA